jgi:hypothetical protein
MMRRIVFLIFFISFKAKAADIGYSVRALGMGNAYTAVVNNSDAIYYNPAGLAKIKGFRWTILDPTLGINNLDSYQDYLDIINDSSDTQSIINQLYGENVTILLGMKSLITMGGFSFGAYGVADSNFSINNPVFPNIDATYRVDYALVAGWGLDLIPDMLSIGFQSRRINRTGGTVPIGVSTIATLDSQAIQDELSRTGIGYAFDLGTTLTFPGALKPTIAFSWRDVGNTKFLPTGSSLAPNSVKQEQIIGLGINYESLLMDIRPALDFRFLNDGDMQLGKKINLGIEFSWPLIDVRGGFHQGYYTLGASFDLWLMRFDVATYGVELGVYPGQLEDRRYMMQISFEFGFDPGSFSLFKLSRPSAREPGRKVRR